MHSQHFIVNYRYDNPHGAGPFKGSMRVSNRYVKGDTIRAPFGAATVVSCRVLKG